jgi:hypothetical protein
LEAEIRADPKYEVIEEQTGVNSLTIRILRNSNDILVIENLSMDHFIIEKSI